MLLHSVPFQLALKGLTDFLADLSTLEVHNTLFTVTQPRSEIILRPTKCYKMHNNETFIIITNTVRHRVAIRTAASCLRGLSSFSIEVGYPTQWRC